jgi:hypothetical protein
MTTTRTLFERVSIDETERPSFDDMRAELDACAPAALDLSGAPLFELVLLVDHGRDESVKAIAAAELARRGETVTTAQLKSRAA